MSQNPSVQGRGASCYLSYGLRINSCLPLPELVRTETSTSDVKVLFGRVELSPDDVTAGHGRFRGTPGEVCLSYQYVGTFLVRQGREVIVQPAHGTDERTLSFYILGPVMSVLLHQRGLLALHGSAVAIDGGAVIFLGEPGRGKSTLAAVMYSLGHGVVADDTVCVDSSGQNDPTVLPAFPQLRLWPDAAASLGLAAEVLPRLHADCERRAYSVECGFSELPLPVRYIYVLADGRRQEIKPLGPRDAFLALVRHSRAARCGSLLATTGTAPSHFLQCVRLARSVPVARLDRPRSLAALPELARFVHRDLGGAAHAQASLAVPASGV